MPERQTRQSVIPELIKSLVPITPMGRAMLIGVIVWFIDWVFTNEQMVLGSRMLKTLLDIFSVLACIPLAYFLVRGVRWVAQHLLWRLRRRLIVTYLLIGALPVLLVSLLVALIGWVVVMQSNARLIEQQLDGYLEQSRAAAQAISRNLSEVDAAGWQPELMQRRLQERADALAPILPDVSLILHQPGGVSLAVSGGSTEGETIHRSPKSNANVSWPNWLDSLNEFHGLVVEEELNGERHVFARHVIKLAQPAGTSFQLSYPIGEGLCEHLRHTTELKIAPGQAIIPLAMTSAGGQIDEAERSEIRRRETTSGAPPMGLLIFKPVTDWQSGGKREREVLVVDSSFLSPTGIWQRVQQFRSGSALGNIIFVTIAGLAFVFMLIALAAVVSAVFLTRSITGAVHYLYEGTMRVEAGDFDHEIKITGRDQLAALSAAFNQMTRSIRELLRVSAEKQRLDQEMRIAAQVQSLLFPRSIPKTEKLDFAPGICIPARSVSGDYYDFIEVASGVTGVVVADVCGKGVSAALMMANLQANLRGQVQACHDAHNFKLSYAAQSGAFNSAEGRQTAHSHSTELQAHPVKNIVQRVNQQVAASVMDSSYITFFYAEIDEQRLILRYTNAGHNPPLLLRANGSGKEKAEPLDCGGTVLGLFRDVEFEDAELKLESGDVLAAFTDGLIEACNPQGEEFGEDRVIQTLIHNAHLSAAEIEQQILRTVKAWTQEAEQEDDLTLVIFKVK